MTKMFYIDIVILLPYNDTGIRYRCHHKFIVNSPQITVATIRDIAVKAGVSVKTVSRVINNEPMVGQETRARVLAVTNELRYVPNILAQRLARGRSMVIGLLIHNATWAYLSDVLEGSLEVARQRGYGIMTRLMDVNKPADHEELLRMVAQQRAEGYLFTPPCDNLPELLGTLQKRNVPFVRLTPHDRRLPQPHVSANDYQGARDMTEHLLSLGHRQIGFVMGNPDHQASHDRLAGFRDTLQARGESLDPTFVRQGDWYFNSGVACGRELLEMNSRPTAIFAGNDDMAAGVLSTAHRMKISVPEALSVAGFDDVPLAEQVWPPLTTVRQPIHQIAKLATTLLIDLLEGKAPSVLHYELPTELVLRESTGRVAA